ncbi:MAG TPA: hypothetical protein VNL71_13375 [Chloroflexota bacterium]|nr:hypothetical protein [Chloroflexota bacterium]
MAKPLEPYSLEDAVRDGSVTAQDLSIHNLLSSPQILSFTADGAMVIALMAGLKGHELGVADRNVVAATDAAVAIMPAQAWVSITARGEQLTDATLRREILTLYAEDRAGNHESRMWYIYPPSTPGGKKTFDLFTGARTKTLLDRIGPLFLFHRFMEDGLSEIEAREKARKVAEKHGVTEKILGAPRRHMPN